MSPKEKDVSPFLTGLKSPSEKSSARSGIGSLVNLKVNNNKNKSGEDDEEQKSRDAGGEVDEFIMKNGDNFHSRNQESVEKLKQNIGGELSTIDHANGQQLDTQKSSNFNQEELNKDLNEAVIHTEQSAA